MAISKQDDTVESVLEPREVGHVVWVHAEGDDPWPAKIVDRDEVEEDLHTPKEGFPEATDENRMVEYFADNKSCSVVHLDLLYEFTSNIHLRSTRPRTKVCRAFKEAYHFIKTSDDADPAQRKLLDELPSLKTLLGKNKENHGATASGRAAKVARIEQQASTVAPSTPHPPTAAPSTPQPPAATPSEQNVSLDEWKKRGTSVEYVKALVVPELGEMLAARILTYRDSESVRFKPVSDALNSFFGEHKLTGQSFVGGYRMRHKDFETKVSEVLAKAENLERCLGYEVELRRFYADLGKQVVEASGDIADWQALELCREAVQDLDPKQLALCLVAYMLQYNSKLNNLHKSLSQAVGAALEKHHIHGGIIIGKNRLTEDDFTRAVKDGLAAEELNKLGHDKMLRDFYKEVDH